MYWVLYIDEVNGDIKGCSYWKHKPQTEGTSTDLMTEMKLQQNPELSEHTRLISSKLRTRLACHKSLEGIRVDCLVVIRNTCELGTPWCELVNIWTWLITTGQLAWVAQKHPTSTLQTGRALWDSGELFLRILHIFRVPKFYCLTSQCQA